MVSKAAQTSLNIEHGPVFRVDVVDLPVQDQKAIHMVAHHLVVDIVSWRIIVQDLTQILETGILPVESPLFFRAWCALQSEHNKSIDAKALLPFEETPSDLSYWGVDQRLTYGTTATESFTLDENMTKLALGDCHRAFRSEPLDVFLAALAHAFAKTFPDRATPTLHTESHGREAPDGSSIDLSGTVGWFTTICPLQVPIHSNDALDAVKRAKDLRRSIPGNGRPYFAHKWLGRTADAILSPMEVLFNYLGGGVSGSDAEGLDVLRETADVGTEATRMALFEISAVVIDNQLHFSFIYDRNLNKVSDVLKWIANCKAVLEEIVQGLTRHPAEPTLSDYPLLPLDYENLRTLVNVALPRVGIRDPCSCIEDIYPCTPVQDGILISQLRDPNAYIFHAVYSVTHKGSHTALDPGRLARAWQKVVSRHPVLRTVFVESFHSDGVFAQAVLKQPHCGAVIIRSRDGEAMARLSESASMTRGDQGQEKRPQLPHRLTICATDSGGLLMKLEINHAALDGGSLPIILDELAAAYAGTLDSSPGPLYSNYIRYIRSTPTTKAVEYWVNHLKGLKPCHFPKLNADTAVTKRLGSTRLQFDRYHELRRLPERTHVTLANIMNVAWALVLRKYTGVDDICFGFLTAGRDIPVDNIDRIVGTLINMLCCRIGISKSQTLADIFRAAQGHYLQSIPFQQCSLAQVQHELGMAGKPLYNTSISTQNHSDKEDAQCENTISFTLEEGHDPSEVSSSPSSQNDDSVLTGLR
jgi:non-ribosomal peptide synthase protein (TIGR01720 family)